MTAAVADPDVTPSPVLVPPLKDACTEAIIKQFDRGTLSSVPAGYRTKIVSRLPLDLPLQLAGVEIDNDKYWKDRSQQRWKSLDPCMHGRSYKQLYFERNLQDVLEEFDAESGDLDELGKLLTFSSHFVSGLEIHQLPSHIDLAAIFDNLGTSLTRLALRYGRRDVGMDYEPSMFGMKLADCRSLAKALESCETLVHLDLGGNSLDDDKVRMLTSGLLNNLSVVRLDLSNNCIADRGARALAKLLHVKSVIQTVDLANNKIHAEGGRALARALRTNRSLCRLQLSLNRLQEEGGRAIFDVLRSHPLLHYLDISHNALGSVTAASIVKLLDSTTAMRELNIAGNLFSEADGQLIRDAVVRNDALEGCDVRMAGLSHADVMAIHDTMVQREVARMQQASSDAC